MYVLSKIIKSSTFPFCPTKSDKDLKTLEIKYTLSNSVFKLQLPIFTEGTPEEFLHFIHEFTQAKSKLGYSSSQKLESGLEQLLQGNARQEWNTIKNTTLPGVQTIASFNERINSYKKFTFQILPQSTINETIYRDFVKTIN